MKFISSFVLFALLATVITVRADEEEVPLPSQPARLLVDKRVENKYLVENQEISVHYKVYNVGEKPALNVVINDQSLPKDYFEWLNATNQIQINKVEPNSFQQRTLLFKPKTGVWGRFNFTFAEVNYQSEGDNTPLYGFTSEPGVGFILSAQEYDRRFSLHLFDWLIFAALTLPSLLIPFLMWYSSKAKYEAILSASKKEKKN